jgi:hypothetical protein
MLNLLLNREITGNNFTPGKLYNKDTGDFLMFSLEDKIRDYNKDGDLLDEGETKVFGETAIPFGTYEGYLRFSPSRGREVPQLLKVPHFSFIQIHSGNSVNETLGCILVGYKRDKDKIWQSVEAERDLISLIKLGCVDGKFTIEIK